ncbi:hypothetical protein [Bradymonas sediminis]|nr:hypothetical protein [Bradymonas sediminis]
MNFLPNSLIRTRFIPGVLALSLAAPLLGACGDDADPDNSNGELSCTNPLLLVRDDLNGGRTLEAGCYMVESTITIDDGTLTLKPGVVIEFGQDAGLQFSGNGALSAIGAADNKIVLSGAVKERGHWAGLHFYGSSSPDNKLEHVVLSHAGSAQWHGGEVSRGGIFLRSASNRLHISNTTFSENAQAAIVADDGGVDFKLESSTFSKNEAPLWLHSNLLGNLSELSFEENEHSYIRTGLTTETIDVEQTWQAFAVPYHVSGTLKLAKTLTLEPGVTIEFEQDKGVEISGEGRLTAVGTAEEMITLTGAEPQRGFWAGLYFYETRSSANQLDFVALEYAGSTNWHGGTSTAGVFARAEGVSLSISNSVFRENAATAILADTDGVDLSVASTSFENNDLPISIAANAVSGLAADLSFSGNDASYVLIGDGTYGREISTSQMWNALQVPYRAAGTLKVTSDLTLSPGMTFEFQQGAGLDVEGGTLAADGSVGDRIQFIAADGETVNGFWKGIYFHKSLSSKNIIANADILYAGSDGWHGGDRSRAGVYLRGGGNDNSKVSMTDVKIAGSGGFGLSVDDGSSVTPCSDVSFQDNTGDDFVGDGLFECL